MLFASDFKVHLPITVFPKLVCTRKRTSHSCPKSSFQPLSKGSDKYVPFDPIAAEMYVMGTLPGNVWHSAKHRLCAWTQGDPFELVVPIRCPGYAETAFSGNAWGWRGGC
jgi:hypothetical protein